MIRHFRPHAAPGLAACALFLLAALRRRGRNQELGPFGTDRFRERHPREPFAEQRWPADARARCFASWPIPRRLLVGAGIGLEGHAVHRRRQSRQLHFEAGRDRCLRQIPDGGGTCPGLQIQAIAVDKRDRVYAATAPGRQGLSNRTQWQVRHLLRSEGEVHLGARVRQPRRPVCRDRRRRRDPQGLSRREGQCLLPDGRDARAVVSH